MLRPLPPPRPHHAPPCHTQTTCCTSNATLLRSQEYINHCLRLHARLADKVKAAGKPLPQAPALTSTPWFEASTGHPLAWNATLANTELDMAELLDLSKRTGILNRQEVCARATPWPSAPPPPRLLPLPPHPRNSVCALSLARLPLQQVLGKTIAGLQELVVYGIKGVCACESSRPPSSTLPLLFARPHPSTAPGAAAAP